MRLFGLIGYPLSHSFSKKYFTEKFEKEGILNCRYELFPLESIEKFPELVKIQPDLAGLNVTIPYKELVIPFLDELDEAAEAVGAVNTIRKKDGKLKGFNTDIYGFEQSLVNLLDTRDHKPEKALVLGTGGAAKAVIYVLKKLNIDSHTVSRHAGKGYFTYDDLNDHIIGEHRLIINTTPLGMSPNINNLPLIPYPSLGPEHFLFDLVYNPAITAFLAKGKNAGAAISNGLEMLYLQAEKAWDIWNP
ncbi:MAG: shikimate dehydrogenase [Bacteroidetes bacterium]|nr:MAG: shikimate dehydrogenase [Bacteroidota bacterium]